MSGFNNIPNNTVAGQLADNLAQNISGIISTKATAKYASGARTILKVNGLPCGFAFAVSWKITTAVKEVLVIDNAFPVELIPQTVHVEGSIGALHIPGQGIGAQLWQPDVLNFLFQQYITIEVRDSATDQLLFYTSKAMITSRQEDIRVDQLASVQLSFRAIGFQDERTPTLAIGATSTETEPAIPQPASRLISDTPQIQPLTNSGTNPSQIA